MSITFACALAPDRSARLPGHQNSRENGRSVRRSCTVKTTVRQVRTIRYPRSSLTRAASRLARLRRRWSPVRLRAPAPRRRHRYRSEKPATDRLAVHCHRLAKQHGQRIGFLAGADPAIRCATAAPPNDRGSRRAGLFPRGIRRLSGSRKKQVRLMSKSLGADHFPWIVAQHFQIMRASHSARPCAARSGVQRAGL